MISMTFVYEKENEVETITISSSTIESCFTEAEMKITKGFKIVNWY